MKAFTEARGRRAPTNWIGCLILLGLSDGGLAARADGPLGPSERPEAYFNGSSYIRINEPLSLKQLVGLSFRTCVGGELFSQRFEGYSLHVTALLSQLVVSWARPGLQREVALPARTLDNRWHWVALRYRPDPPSIHLTLDKETQVISNVTWNPELLSPGALEAGGATLLVGNVFGGCLREGPQLEFHAAHSTERHVVFGPCPLSTDDCTDRKDVLIIPPKDHCLNEPCMRHGSCISRHDRYECHCTARYTGNNCEVDAGSPCLAMPCRHGGRCIELPQGDYRCSCSPNYRGEHCELEVSLDPQCVAQPCQNNGSCSVPPGSDTYVCDCPPGFTGRDCGADVDECAAAGPGACLHGGRCVDARGNYTCDCTGTGYTGARCGDNVNECLVAGVCGHGLCYDTHGGHVCACRPGYTGARCDTPSACASGPCGVGGACVEEAGVWRCVCAKGYAPPLCAAPAPPPDPPAPLAPPPALSACQDVVCPPRSHCREPRSASPPLPTMLTGVVLTKQVVCVCDPGYYGLPGPAPNCSTAESACEAAVCANGATCSARGDRLDCQCAPGYKGAYCEQPAAAAGKALEPRPAGAAPGPGAGAERCAAQPCMHASDCQDTPTGFRCECLPGWSGARCDSATATEPCVRCVLGACPDAAPGCVCCDATPDCRAQPCPPRQECVEDGGVWSCVSPTPDGCAAAPCHNGSCLLADDRVGFRCVCPPGTTGRYCEGDVDECAMMPKICNYGVCVNVPGSYQCYCRPGYTGDSCEQDIDECLSSPCKNGGTCQNLENNYECDCVDGFGGKDCSVNINECAPSPCAAGSTCVDGVASYSCICQPGLTGLHCEIDIDDCESAPCQHGGRCVDQLRGYSCDCAGTGHAGADCELNVDECASAPCRHGATCLDDVNDYRCVCHPGYTGKECETDVNECESSPCQHGGVCLQRSDAAQYRAAGAPPEQVGAQPHQLLPRLFYQPFAYENASGYECVCVEGTRGARCEVNVDECASAPCGHGTCADEVGGYTCLCAAGYEGTHCEREIDECVRYRPCAHGRCFDRRASYYCACAAGWGGRNCTVELQGCRGRPCRNNGTCRPWLRGETEHRYNCSCRPGHQGTTCQRITTMSLEKSSYVEVNTTREEGYDISLRFKTTLGSGLLAMGRGLTYFFLELSNGRLNLHSSLLNKWEGVFIGSNLNDSNWQKVFVTINSSHVVLAANEEQTIYPISQNEAFNGSVTSFPSTRLGTAGSSYATLTHGPNFFVGCFQDVLVNGLWVLPEDPEPETEPETSSSELEPEQEPEDGGRAATALLRGVGARCPRRAQCAPNPCRSGGHCEDAWTSFTCTCPRPYLGDTCQYNYTAATFWHESARSPAAVLVRVSPAARAAVQLLQALHISMFVRTRKPTGVIFYLGSGPKHGATDETLVGASLRGGELLVQLRFNQTPEEYAVGGTRLDNGHVHLIEVVRNSTLVQVKLNGTEYFRKSVSAAKQLDAQVLYLGGPPPPPLPPADATAPATTPPPDDADYFKGVIQDVQISNGMNVSVVELFPLGGGLPGLGPLPPAFGEVVLPGGGAVRRGAVSDDACAARPCLHDAPCATTWNDYECACPRGYKGKQCAEVEFCQLQGCPVNSHCRNLDQGYECVSNATFDGVNTTLTYQLRAGRLPGTAAPPPHQPDSLEIVYRTRWGGTLLHVAAADGWFSVAALRGQVAVQWRLAGGLPRVRRMRVAEGAAGGWLTARFAFARDTVTAAIVDADGQESPGFTEALDTAAWQRLVSEGLLQLGGVRPPAAPAATTAPAAPAAPDTTTDLPVWEYGEGEEPPIDNSVGEYFKGCMGGVHVGGLLLPFFTEEQLFVGAAAALLAAQPHYALLSGRAWGAAAGVGCVLCLERDCAHGGHCADVRSLYTCACPKGFSGDHCEVDVDECLSHECKNGATCRDGLASYTCECPDGYDGEFCENDIDECQSEPCGAGATCSDLPGGFRCACPPARAGPTCRARASCLARPCGPHAVACVDRPPEPPTGNNYTCECAEGFAGVHCELPYCQLRPCDRGVCVQDAESPYCECEEGFAGRYCEAEAGAAASDCGGCLHGGRCVPAPRPRCDCEGTGWRGARCEVDVDECALGLVSCGPGECRNLEGSYICECAEGFCGNECALLDPCFQPAPPPGPEATEAGGAAEAGAGTEAALGPCSHGARCSQRCTSTVDYVCACSHGWAGRNCSQQAAWGSPGAGGGWAGGWRWALAAGGALLLLLALGGGAAAAAGARRTRATRGTYSPSGQEYCNPRAASTARALQPPPEERLI